MLCFKSARDPEFHSEDSKSNDNFKPGVGSCLISGCLIRLANKVSLPVLSRIKEYSIFWQTFDVFFCPAFHALQPATDTAGDLYQTIAPSRKSTIKENQLIKQILPL